MMTRRARWLTGVFLTLTTVTLGWEIWAAADNDPDTWPWTELIVAYVPAPVTYAAIAILATWLPAHFAIYYRRKAKQAQSTLDTAAFRAYTALREHPTGASGLDMVRLATIVRQAIRDARNDTPKGR